MYASSVGSTTFILCWGGGVLAFLFGRIRSGCFVAGKRLENLPSVSDRYSRRSKRELVGELGGALFFRYQPKNLVFLLCCLDLVSGRGGWRFQRTFQAGRYSVRRWTLVIIVVYIIVTYPVDEGLSVAFLYVLLLCGHLPRPLPVTREDGVMFFLEREDA